MYTVNLTYFKFGGKYYATGSYATSAEHLYDIWSDVRQMQNDRCLPGLVHGHSAFIVLVEVPDHPHAHPHLIIPAQDDPDDTTLDLPKFPDPEPKFEPPVMANPPPITPAGARKVMKVLGYVEKTGTNDRADWFNVFKDKWYGIVVQVPDRNKAKTIAALKANGFSTARIGEGMYNGNIYC